jgi:hypothetical protein
MTQYLCRGCPLLGAGGTGSHSSRGSRGRGRRLWRLARVCRLALGHVSYGNAIGLTGSQPRDKDCLPFFFFVLV